MQKNKTAMMELIDYLESQISMVDNNSDHEDIAYADGMNYAKEIAIKLIEKEKVQTINFATWACMHTARKKNQLITDGIEELKAMYNEMYKQNESI